jgi:hypothetical protein
LTTYKRLVNTSLGLQEDTKTATITFQKQDEKKKAKKRKDKVTKPAEVDDRFLNLTVLHSPNDHDLEYGNIVSNVILSLSDKQ